MSDKPLSLDAQLISRVRQFLRSTGYSQRQLARMLSCDAGNFSAYLAGAKSLSVTKMHKLLQILNLSRLELEAKFAQPRLSSQILELQESGQKLEFDNGSCWVPGLVNGGSDPDGSTDITGTSRARDLDNADDYQAQTIAFLKDQQNIHRSAIAEIDKYLAGIQRGKVNGTGTTSGPRTVPSNETSKTPGPRATLLSDPAKLRDQLEFVRAERKKSEAQLELQAELDRERKLYWDARVKTLRKQDGQ